jgi:isopentenyl-diphosphate Delta-isomerase
VESLSQFENRKQDHIRLALDPKVQTNAHGLDAVELIHEALPDLSFSEVNIETEFAGRKLSSPLFISSMTAGHVEGYSINKAFAQLSSRRQILMGVGSQRRELLDASARSEWKSLRKETPHALLVGNLGLTQLIHTPVAMVQELVDSLEALALFIHLNPLQEVLQPEGTPDFKGGLKKIEEIAKTLSVPVIVKEVGCGFSIETLKRFEGTGIYAVDISGFGGTHWGRIEGLRGDQNSVQAQAAATFSNWGISTLESMLNAKEAHVTYQVWASGGVRNGLEAGKLLALGGTMVGLAQPWLAAYKDNQKNPSVGLNNLADRLDFELKTALFCTGSKNIKEFQEKKVWKWRQKT